MSLRTEHKVEGGATRRRNSGRSGRQTDWGNISESWIRHVIPKIEMRDSQVSISARICSVLFDNRENRMLAKLVVPHAGPCRDSGEAISDEVIREKRLVFGGQTISRSHRLTFFYFYAPSVWPCGVREKRLLKSDAKDGRKQAQSDLTLPRQYGENQQIRTV
jgi:hypothetical protein